MNIELDLLEEDGAAEYVDPIFDNNHIVLPPFYVDKSDNKEYSLEDVPDKSIYYQLIHMFPYCNSNTIRKLLIKPPFNPKGYDKNQLLAILVDYCLQLDTEPEKELNIIEYESVEETDMNELADYLRSIYPDIDPLFILQFLNQNHGNYNVVDKFCDEVENNPNVPSIKEYYERERLDKLRRKFNDFKVEKFLKLYNDPFHFFENKKRKCYYNENILSYLKKVFTDIEDCHIEESYKHCFYNLTLTIQDLTNIQSLETENLTFNEISDEETLKEIAFIKNRDEIKSFLSALEENEKEELEQCEINGSLVECDCCFTKIIPSQLIICSKMHIFCKPCIAANISFSMSEGIYSLSCIKICESNFTLNDIERCLNKDVFEKFSKMIQETEIKKANIGLVEYCPFCNMTNVISEDDIIFKCINPLCMKKSCRKCKASNHFPSQCKTVSNAEKARLLLEEKMTKCFIRECVKCKISIYKDDGCNKITCHVCKTKMCYLCNVEVDGTYNHFRSQGSDRYDLCPLWSDTEKYDAEYIRKIALETKSELESENPDINVDIEKLLPSVPNGNHYTAVYDSILSNGDKLTEYIRIRDRATEK